MESNHDKVFVTTFLGVIGFLAALTVGIVVIAVAMLALAFLGLRLWKQQLAVGGMTLRATYLAGALIAAVFAHGAVESASLAGSTVAAMLMGIGAGLIDRLPKLVDDLPDRHAKRARSEWSEHEYDEHGYEGGHDDQAWDGHDEDWHDEHRGDDPHPDREPV